MKDRSCMPNSRRNATVIRATVITAALLAIVGGIAPLGHAEIVAKLAVMDPASQQAVTGPLTYQGSCPVTLQFAGKIGSSVSGPIQYRFVRSDGAIAPITSITVEAGKSHAVETKWTLARSATAWMEIEILYPQPMKSNRVEFKVDCSTAGGTSSTTGRARPAGKAIPAPQQAQETVSPARPAGKAIPKEKADSQARPAGKATAKPAVASQSRATFFVAGDRTGVVDIFDQSGTKIRSFQARYTTGDGFGVGDVNGDGADEIIIAGDVHGRVNVYSQKGERISQFDGRFSKNDGFAIGDVNGDRRDEIIIAGDKSGVIDIFTWQGQKIRSFNGRFTKNDAFAAGDVDGDGIDEILIHGDRHGHVNAFNIAGGKVASFDTKLSSDFDESRDSGIGAGDVTGDRVPDIIVAFEIGGGGTGLMKTDFDIKKICVFDVSGKLLSCGTGEFTMGDTLRVGDVNGDGVAEIVKAGDKFRSVTVFDGSQRQLMTFIAGYTKNDGFAIARHR
ncbi:MAG: hypothetical protein HXY20_05065 [Acidobacteria bacterium]|nr:hypothetical protein [Acidobacteriota bacterium]